MVIIMKGVGLCRSILVSRYVRREYLLFNAKDNNVEAAAVRAVEGLLCNTGNCVKCIECLDKLHAFEFNNKMQQESGKTLYGSSQLKR